MQNQITHLPTMKTIMFNNCTIYAKQSSFILNIKIITNLHVEKINVIEKLQEQNVL